MTENVYEAPESELESPDKVIFNPVTKPWTIWLVVAWIFIFIGITAKSLGPVTAELLNESEQAAKGISALYIVLVFVLMIGVAKLEKTISYLTAFIFIILGLLQMLNIIIILSKTAEVRSMVLIFVLYALPSFTCAWYILREKHRTLIKNNANYKKFNASMKLK